MTAQVTVVSVPAPCEFTTEGRRFVQLNGSHGNPHADLGSYRQERPVAIGDQWTECLGSEFHAAVEARADLETKIRSL